MQPYCQFCGKVTDHFWYACPKRPKTGRGAPRVETRPLEAPPKPRRLAMLLGGLGRQPEPATEPTPTLIATKPPDETKAAPISITDPAPKKGGRPRTGEKALTSTERSRKRRERLKAQKGA